MTVFHGSKPFIFVIFVLIRIYKPCFEKYFGTEASDYRPVMWSAVIFLPFLLWLTFNVLFKGYNYI